MNMILRAKEKFAQNLMSRESKPFPATILYMVYKTIEANNNITTNQLTWLLGSDCMLHADTISGALTSLTSKSLFNCVSRWQPQPTKGGSTSRPTHLRVREPASNSFSEWLVTTVAEYPELEVFEPPLFLRRDYQKELTVRKEEAVG